MAQLIQISRLSALLLFLVIFAACKRQESAIPPERTEIFLQAMQSGRNYYDTAETEKAVGAFSQAVGIMPASLEARLNLANASLLHGDTTNAIRQADEAIKLNHDNAAAHFVLGCAYLRESKFSEGLKSLQISYQMAPEVSATIYQMGRAHLELNQLDEAISAFQKTIELQPNHPAVYYSLSQALNRAGKAEQAKVALEQHTAAAASLSGATTVATFERSVHTSILVPSKPEQPLKQGVTVKFVDATTTVLGTNAASYQFPVAIIDYAQDCRNNLFVRQGDNFFLLANQGGIFQPEGEPVPANPGHQFHQVLVGDLQHDRVEDIIVLGEPSSQVFRVRTNGLMDDVTAFCGLKGLSARSGVLVDLDFTGNLDLCVVNSSNQAVDVFRNLGNLYFKNATATSGVPASITQVNQLGLDDWNNDDLMDLVLGRSGQKPTLLTKIRGGNLMQTNAPASWTEGICFTLGDVNNDLRSDLLILGKETVSVNLGGLEKRIEIKVGTHRLDQLKLVDYDNDGWLDLVGIGSGLRVWRNLGEEGFREVTAELGLESQQSRRFKSIHTADFDGDGDLDLVTAMENTGLAYFRNDGANKNHLLKLKLIGNRSNASGLGIRIEVASGGLRLIRTIHQLPVEIGVAAHAKLDSVTVRWFDLATPSVDLEVTNYCIPQLELTIPGGSCPNLYTWNGATFDFVTDLLGASPLGLPLTEGKRIEADPEEYVHLGSMDQMVPRNNNFVLSITEELREVLYLDQAKLVVVDHPRGTTVHPSSKLLPGKPFPPHQLQLFRNETAPLKAVRNDGQDVTKQVASQDQRRAGPASLRVPQLRGLAAPFSVTLDFGPLDLNRPLALVLNGWLRFGGGMANMSASRNPDLPFPFPVLEAEITKDRWVPVDVQVGAPAGKTKTIFVDLTGKLPSQTKRLRLTTAFEIYWDKIALCEPLSQQAVVQSLKPVKSDLHWRGYSHYENLPAEFPLTPNYTNLYSAPKWRITPSGWYTRYGQVQELVSDKDNALVVMGGGDELILEFAQAALGPVPDGHQRDFFLFTVGWDKDADFHVTQGWTVEPLPFHGQNNQMYGLEKRPASPGDELMKKMNTRWVSLMTFERRQ